MEELYQAIEEVVAEVEESPSAESSETVQKPLSQENPEEQTAKKQLELVAEIVARYGGSGAVDTLGQEVEAVMEGLINRHATELEVSRKTGMLTFALSQLVYDPGAVLALMDLETVAFDPGNVGDLRDCLEPIYQEKPYLFKTINPLRGAIVAQGVIGNTLPTNGELGMLSMEEYTAYRNARGSVSH